MSKRTNQQLLMFGNAVRRRRIALGLSQEALADICELDRTYIGGIERGERNVAIINILKLAKALKTTPAKLFDEAGA